MLINNVVMLSGVQPSDSVRDIHVSILFQSFFFPFMSFDNIEQNSLCCPVDPCWFSILNITVCACHVD